MIDFFPSKSLHLGTLCEGFPDGLVVENQLVNAGDVGSVPRLGSFSEVGNGIPLHYSCLENPMDSNVGLLLRRCSGKGLHLAMAGEPRGFSRVTAGFSSYDGEYRLPLVLAQASPIFHSSCERKLGIALE